jgi:hypothetical protein
MSDPDPLPPLTPETVQQLHALLDGPHAAVRALTRERRAWWLDNGYVDATTSKDLRTEVAGTD